MAAYRERCRHRVVSSSADARRSHPLAACERDNGYVLRVTSETLRADRKFVLKAVQRSCFALRSAEESLRADRNVVLAAVKQNGRALEYADASLKKDKEVVLAAVAQYGLALEYADESLKKDKEVVLAAVAVRALAGIFSLCEGAHPPVTHVIPFGNQGFDLRVCRVVFFRSKIDITALFGDFRDIELLFFSRVRHHGLLSSVRQDPAHCLGRVIHNRNDPSVIQSCRADNPYGADNLSIRVHIRTDDQRGTRK